MNQCIIFLRAISESHHRGYRSELFDSVSSFSEIEPSDEVLSKVEKSIDRLIGRCGCSPFIVSAFRIKAELNKYQNKDYFVDKLVYFLGQGNAQAVFEICLILSDMDEDVWLDKHGSSIQSHSFNETEINMGVARRYLERNNKLPNNSIQDN